MSEKEFKFTIISAFRNVTMSYMRMMKRLEEEGMRTEEVQLFLEKSLFYAVNTLITPIREFGEEKDVILANDIMENAKYHYSKGNLFEADVKVMSEEELIK